MHWPPFIKYNLYSLCWYFIRIVLCVMIFEFTHLLLFLSLQMRLGLFLSWLQFLLSLNNKLQRLLSNAVSLISLSQELSWIKIYIITFSVFLILSSTPSLIIKEILKERKKITNVDVLFKHVAIVDLEWSWILAEKLGWILAIFEKNSFCRMNLIVWLLQNWQ